MNRFTALVAAGLVAGSSTVAFASSDYCASAPRAQWRSMADAKAAVEALGYKQVRKIEADDGCYEAYALDKDGRRVEIYLDPVHLKVVKVEGKS